MPALCPALVFAERLPAVAVRLPPAARLCHLAPAVYRGSNRSPEPGSALLGAESCDSPS